MELVKGRGIITFVRAMSRDGWVWKEEEGGSGGIAVYIC